MLCLKNTGMISVQLCWLGTVGEIGDCVFITTECINAVNVFGSSFLNSVFVIIYGMGTSSLNETIIEHALLPADGTVMYEFQSGVLSIIDTVKARTML
jgi:hypothetical protein